MRKLALLFFGVAITLGVFVAPALATGPPEPPPGSIECPPSTHDDGTGTCVPNGGGVGNCGQNEGDNGNGTGGDNGYGNGDGCATTTTTVVTTTTEAPPTTTTTTTATEPPATTTTETQPPVDSTTTTTASPPVEPPSKTDGPKHTRPNSSTGGGSKGNGPKLAFTGVEDVVPIGAAALALATLGTGLMWAGRRRRDAE